MKRKGLRVLSAFLLSLIIISSVPSIAQAQGNPHNTCSAEAITLSTISSSIPYYDLDVRVAWDGYRVSRVAWVWFHWEDGQWVQQDISGEDDFTHVYKSFSFINAYDTKNPRNVPYGDPWKVQVSFQTLRGKKYADLVVVESEMEW